ncbi:MAG: nodulation protein NfeD [Gammaproteobacteria bacterium]
MAREEGARLVILRMDTPGGLDNAMRAIIQDMLSSPIPVVSYVAPSGARAASAGTYIMYASQVAAMAPGTNLGAATPVQVGGLPGTSPGGGQPAKPGQGGGSPQPGDAMKHKIVNDAVAYIRSLAELRGRNVEWAEKAVREAASLPASEALEKHVIDVIAPDTSALLAAIDGRTVTVPRGQITLHTQGLTLRAFEPDWRTRLLATLTDPNVAYLLMLLGFYGLFFELANPGFVLPGVAGAICLVLALYAFQVLPVNYAGVALILLGILFMVAEVFVPSFGALGIGGVTAFVFGSVILFNEGSGVYAVSVPLIASVALVSAGFFIGIVGMAIRARGRPVVSGQEQMLHAVGEALEDFQGRGRVRVHSELWTAESNTALQRGQKVQVTGIEGLVLKVEPLREEH